MADQAMKSTLRVIKALSDIQRLRILMLLRGGELCVCQIIEVLGLAPSTVSKHLSILSAAGLTDSRKLGRWMHYRLAAPDSRIRQLLRWINASLDSDELTMNDARNLENVKKCDPENICRIQRRRRARGVPGGREKA